MEPGIVAHLTPRHDGAMTTTLYGLPNCDTVRRARAWLDERGVAYRFHDLGRQGVPEAELDRWLQAPGWEALVNRRGTTWRRLVAAGGRLGDRPRDHHRLRCRALGGDARLTGCAPH
jgi:hypothetical protein